MHKRATISILMIVSIIYGYSQTQIPLYSHQIPNSKNIASKERIEERGYRNRAIYDTSIPTMTIYQPAQPNGTAVIICPGGGYMKTAFDKEGTLVAEELMKAGITSFVLKYRIPQDTYHIEKSIAPLQDAQQAIRYVRTHADQYLIKNTQIGILGFSAGGHLAASAANHFDLLTNENDSDLILTRPDFVGLIYPVISFDKDITHMGSRTQLIGLNPSQEETDKWSMEKQVTSDSPPAFIIHSSDDRTVPVENSIRYYQACHIHGVPAEMHLFPSGGHGFGLNNKTTKDQWTMRFIQWIEELFPSEYYPRDTSYTIESTYKKLKERYPSIRSVKESLQGIISKENLVYAKVGKERNLHMDIYHPYHVNDEKLPAILMIHGGGWAAGRKENMSSMAMAFAQRGYVVANIEYRLSGEAPYPAAVIDIKTALKFLRAHAESYNINKEKIAVYGCSAGAQLASLIGTTQRQELYSTMHYTSESHHVAAVLNIDGIVSFVHPEAKSEWTGSAANSWLGSYQSNYSQWVEASPLTHLDSSAPPFLFVNSSIARFHAGRDEFIQKLKSHNIYSEVYTLDESPHSFWFFDPWFGPTLDYCDHFLKKIFK